MDKEAKINKKQFFEYKYLRRWKSNKYIKMIIAACPRIDEVVHGPISIRKTGKNSDGVVMSVLFAGAGVFRAAPFAKIGTGNARPGILGARPCLLLPRVRPR